MKNMIDAKKTTLPLGLVALVCVQLVGVVAWGATITEKQNAINADYTTMRGKVDLLVVESAQNTTKINMIYDKLIKGE